MNRDELDHYLRTYLEVSEYSDYCPNGLQIEGKFPIKKIAFAVSATKESVAQSCAWGADALIVHHGVFWSEVKPIKGAFASRIKPLIKNDINLFAYHLPLDGHQECGNAVEIAKKLGGFELEGFGDHKGKPIGVKGKIHPVSSINFQYQLEQILLHSVIMASENPEDKISSFGIITGGASSKWREALKENLDAFITGEVHEYDWHDARESGIHFFAGGHHATEKFGVLALQKVLENKFRIETKFFDSENPA